jgi:hypothetical protein
MRQHLRVGFARSVKVLRKQLRRVVACSVWAAHKLATRRKQLSPNFERPAGLMQPGTAMRALRARSAISRLRVAFGTLEKPIVGRRTRLLRLTYIGANGAGYDKGPEGALKTAGELN